MRKKRLWGIMLALALAVSGCGQAAETGNGAETPAPSSGEQPSSEGEPSSSGQPSSEGEPSSSGQPSSEGEPSPSEQPPKEQADGRKLYENRPVSLKQMEALNRGFVAVKSAEGVFLSWRFLGTDSETLAFNIYKNGSLLNPEPVADVTSYLDKEAAAQPILWFRFRTERSSRRSRRRQFPLRSICPCP